MKILTWNINGIRTRLSLQEDISLLDADIICFQETKVTRDMLEEPTAIINGYTSYFSFSRKKTGYSGVATYCRDNCTPVSAEEGLSGLLNPSNQLPCPNLAYFHKDELQALDAEGRAVITKHHIRTVCGKERELAVINVYVPRVDSERPDRLEYKLKFLDLLQTRAKALLNQGSHVLVLGDLNISHQELDHCNPDSEEFVLRKDRQWLSRFLWSEDASLLVGKEEEEGLQTLIPESEGGHFIDSFRYLHPDQKNAFTCWCTLTSSRLTNYGTRLDYILGDTELVNTYLTSCLHMTDVHGSDHCPVKAEFTVETIPARKVPSLCTKNMPEFSGKQQKLSSFFRTAVKNEESNSSQNMLELPTFAQTITSFEPSNNKKRQSSQDLGMNGEKKRKVHPKKSNFCKQGDLFDFFRNKTSGIRQLNSSNNSSKNSDYSKSTRDQSETDTASKEASTVDTANASSAWKGLLGGLGKPPLCQGHKEPCIIRMVKKDGPNKFRQFYVCARAEGHSSNPEARCNHFEWQDKRKLNK